MAINRTKQARQMLKEAGAVTQDGVLNYIKNSESVTVPKEFKARKNAPATKLAYITADEAKMLKKEKPGTPHKGPKGIPSYDSFDAKGGFTSGAAMSAAESGRNTSDTLAAGMSGRDVQNLRSSAIAAGAGQRVNPGFFDSKNIISRDELDAARAFARDRNNRFARAALRNRQGGLLGLITSGGLLGNVIRGIGQKFGLGKRFNEPTYDMSKFNELGLFGQVPEDFEDEKISLESFIKPQDTIGRVNLNDLKGLSELDFLGRTNLSDLEGLTSEDFLRPDEGLLEVPSDFIDQGIITALSKNDIPIRLASALTTPTEGKFGLNLLDYSKLKSNRYNDSQIKEAIEGGYVNDLLKTLSLATGGRANAMDGGIMDLETGRQGYFLGKLVKKAKRAVKKVVKSPVGKAALGLAALNFAPAFLSGKGFGLGKAKSLSDLVFFGKDANVNPFRLIGIPTALAGLLTPKQEDEEIDIAKLYGSGAINQNALLNRRILGTEFVANGGRIGYSDGSDDKKNKPKKLPIEIPLSPLDERINELYEKLNLEEGLKNLGKDKRKLNAEGGLQKEPVAKKVMPLLDMGGKEMDLRAEGGFVPIGRMEKADDVPARLSKNEFVFTADAVRNAGGGDVDKGAEVMYNMMKNLEAGGEVSEESQGLEGAREMFQTSQRLGEVI